MNPHVLFGQLSLLELLKLLLLGLTMMIHTLCPGKVAPRQRHPLEVIVRHQVVVDPQHWWRSTVTTGPLHRRGRLTSERWHRGPGLAVHYDVPARKARFGRVPGSGTLKALENATKFVVPVGCRRSARPGGHIAVPDRWRDDGCGSCRLRLGQRLPDAAREGVVDRFAQSRRHSYTRAT